MDSLTDKWCVIPFGLCPHKDVDGDCECLLYS